MAAEQLALFPLALVALPGERVALHIFEPRYLAMIDERLDGGEFGIVWQDDEERAAVGCACAVAEVSETHEDGRMDIVVLGTRRFQVLELGADAPYPTALVEWLGDDAQAGEPAVLALARELYADLVEQATDEMPAPEKLARLDSFAIAAAVELDTATRQQLLELRSEQTRLDLLVRLMRAAVRRIELLDEAQERARSNGHVERP